MTQKAEFKKLVDNYRQSSGKDQSRVLKDLAAKISDMITDSNNLQRDDIAYLMRILNEEPLLIELIDHLSLKDIHTFLGGILSQKKEFVEDMGEDILNFLRRPPLLKKIYSDSTTDEWFELIKEYIYKVNFNLFKLLRQRVGEYKDKTLFQVLGNNKNINVSWEDAYTQIENIGRALYTACDGKPPVRVGIFARNSLEMALTDLACISSGIPNAMIPADSSSNQLKFMLSHAEVELLFVGNAKLYEVLKPILSQLPGIKKIISFTPIGQKKVEDFSHFITDDSSAMAVDKWMEKAASVPLEKPVTVMYTSGTTGESKGIVFKQRHMITKRYARALALPEIGSNDVFLCYLPLFHTFGRYFELQGSLFWGAIYAFAENPSIDVLLRDFKTAKPTVFISIPKKWKQIQEDIRRKIDVDVAPDDEIDTVLKKVTGGKLKWGLSAAGYLDPEIFRFFQHYNISLLSGFGMTEATGGILMTPPENYKDDSLGIALPGVETKLHDDGELWLRGVYVYDEYLKPPEGITPRNEQGWFESGDIMIQDNDKAYTIIDRKKEIYKNIKGQTIAPQKIENYFREFKSLKHIFLVGDHREYNTVLIVPDYTFSDGYLETLSESEFRNFFSSLIVSVNRFLAPYERIVDFAILKKDFDPDTELTPKGTFRRKVIVEKYIDIIDNIYDQPWLSLTNNEIEIRLPNWYLREKGITGYEISFSGDKMYHKPNNEIMNFRYDPGEWELVMGNYRYKLDKPVIDFGSLFLKPGLWLGNREFVNFFGQELMFGSKMVASEKTNMIFTGIAHSTDDESDSGLTVFDPEKSDNTLLQIHNALVNLLSRNDEGKEAALTFIEDYLSRDFGDYKAYILDVLRMLPEYISRLWRQKIFVTLISHEKDELFLPAISHLWIRQPDLLSRETMLEITQRKLTDSKVKKVLNFTKIYFYKILDTIRQDQVNRLRSMLEFLSVYTEVHPAQFKPAREIVIQYILQDSNPAITAFAQHYYIEMLTHLREWLGTNQQLVIDPETGMEYRWEDVVTFDEGISVDSKMLILKAFKEAPVLKETIFIFNKRDLIQLRDIPEGGIWISELGTIEDWSRFRATIQTRNGESYDLILNLNHSTPDEQLEHYLHLLVACGETETEESLTEEFGGYWPSSKIWTREYIHAETISHYMNRKIKQNKPSDIKRIKGQWANFVWSSFMLSVKFWERSNQQYFLKDMTCDNFVVPLSDYQIGARINNIAFVKAEGGPFGLLLRFLEQFVLQTKNDFPHIIPDLDPLIFTFAIVEAVGNEKGELFFKEILKSGNKKSSGIEKKIYDGFNSILNDSHPWKYYPRRLYFAITRFHRWRELSQNWDTEANAAMLRELYTTYQFNEYEIEIPDIRLRFYYNTVFRDSNKDFRDGITELMDQLKNKEFTKEIYTEAISSLRNTYKVDEMEEFFLTRLTNPYLMPSDTASFVELEEEGKRKTEIVVYFHDNEGDQYIVRGPVNPKEVAKLYHLFLESNLPVQFRPEHKFLIVLNERGVLIGGLFYYFINRESIRLEKLVVKMPFRRKGVSAKLIKELFARLRNIDARTVSTGFYRPEFFYKFNFKVENQYEGLVKDLTVEDPIDEEATIGGIGLDQV